MRKLAVVVLALAACSPRGGEGWAKKYLGEEGRETLRSDATVMTSFQGHAAAKPGARPYLPRPYVVLAFPEGESRPFFHDVNLELQTDSPPSSAASVKGIVVLRIQYELDHKARSTGRQRGHYQYDILLVDRASRTMTHELLARNQEQLPAFIAGLPEVP